jgi:hypothetical protein
LRTALPWETPLKERRCLVTQILDLAPDIVNIVAYAGDTIGPIQIKHSAGFVAGRVYTAQIRPDRKSTQVDAVFDVQVGATEDDPVFLTLSSDITRSLVGSREKYQGFWDCQIAPAGGGDPTRTVVQGKVTLTLDVTREA